MIFDTGRRGDSKAATAELLAYRGHKDADFTAEENDTLQKARTTGVSEHQELPKKSV